jgi:hypothetical protein
MRRRILMVPVVAAVILSTASSLVAAKPHDTTTRARAAQGTQVTHLRLTASTPQLAACMPHASLRVTVKSTVDQIGFDSFRVRARHLAPDRAYTVFLLETAGPPFGAAEYIGDIFTDHYGNATNTFRLIVGEAFASTLVNGARTRVDLNQVGMWFADPADDDFCPATPGTDRITPFDGDAQAGVQAFNSANTQPLPAP